MSPLDDELRRALRSRADALDPAPDPLAGIESRARGLRRRRLAASVAGAVLAVSAVAVAVPLVLSESAPTAPSQVATASLTPTPSAPVQELPANVLDWVSRGDATVGPDTADLLTRFAAALQGTHPQYRPLFTGDTDSGVHYTLGQAWFPGADKAYTVALATGGTTEFFLGAPTPVGAHVVAWSLSNLPGTVGELLVVVPEPRTTQVLYDSDATGPFTPRDGAPGLDGVVLIDRAAAAAGSATDRLQLLTGNGDPATDVSFQGPVASLLCGVSGCG